MADEPLRRRLVVTIDGVAVPVTHLFGEDSRGKSVSVQDLSSALTFVAGPTPEGKWLAGPTADQTFADPH